MRPTNSMSESADETTPGRSAYWGPRLKFRATCAIAGHFDLPRDVTALEPNVALGYSGASPIARKLLRGLSISP